MRVNFNPNTQLTIFVLMAGTLPLGFALASQYVGGLHPCHFCVLQRYPYALVTLCGLGLLALRAPLMRGVLVAVALLALWATAALALAHVGIEQHWLKYEGGCVAAMAADTSIEALRAQIMGAPLVACDEAAAKLFGVSMAGWNTLTALGLSAGLILFYRRSGHV